MIAQKTPMGISLARTFGADVTEELVLSCAAAMKDKGLIAAGYEYIIIGDGYALPRRDRATGELQVDTSKFPGGMKALADKLHGMGLKLGIMTSAGAATVNGAPGCVDKEYIDADTFAEWGIDYISHDTSFMPPRASEQSLIRRMGMALRNCGREILYSVFSKDEKLHVWIRSAGANAYCDRSFTDASGVLSPNTAIAGYSADYCWHNCGELTVDGDLAYLRVQLAIASIMSSPMIVDCDVRALSDEVVALLTNKDLISVATDEEGRPAKAFYEGVYVKYLENREYAIAFVNTSDAEKTLEFYAYDFGMTWNAGYALEAEGIFGAEGKTEFDQLFTVKVNAGDAAVYKLRFVR